MADLTDVGFFHYNVQFENGLTENEIDHVLAGEINSDTPISPNSTEVHAYRWVAIPELQAELITSPHTFTHWFTQALTVLLAHIQK